MNKAPLLFEDEPTEQERFLKQLAVEQAFSIQPNGGQTWQFRVGRNEDGSPQYKTIHTIGVANTAPECVSAGMKPMVMYRTEARKLKAIALDEWFDADTIYVGKTKEIKEAA